ncbi:DHH family phosphoesterase [Candidatus Saccharibacteria bacterium]|nr:DHH family phosphoesterase [Candidatus Saccharibacteria bacterium]
MLNDSERKFIADAKKILVIQAENPDGDSLGSALALEEIFGVMGKKVALYCPVQIPTYLRHIAGWDRVGLDFPTDADMAIIVDTSSKVLLSKTLENPVATNFLNTHPVLVFDHHISVTPDLPFDAQYIISDTAVATGELIFDLAQGEKWTINATAATNLFISIQADSLGLTTAATTAKSFETCAELVKLGADPADIEEKRRELMKKKPEILKYKGQLIERIEYFNDGRTALVLVPFDEIQEYSNDYNPTMLVLDEMRLVIGVDVAIGIKTYPDGKLTGKLRTNIPVSDAVAGFFGGGGHPYAAGFRIYEKYDEFLPELIQCLEKIYADYDNENPPTKSESKETSGDNFKSFRIKEKN